MNICKNCNQPIADGPIFCTKCGAAISGTSAADSSKSLFVCTECSRAVDYQVCKYCGAQATEQVGGGTQIAQARPRRRFVVVLIIASLIFIFLIMAVLVGISMSLAHHTQNSSSTDPANSKRLRKLDPAGLFLNCRITDGRYGVATGSNVYIISNSVQPYDFDHFSEALIYSSGELRGSFDLTRNEDGDGVDIFSGAHRSWYDFQTYRDANLDPSGTAADDMHELRLMVYKNDLSFHWMSATDASTTDYRVYDYTKGTCSRMSAAEAQDIVDDYRNKVKAAN